MNLTRLELDVLKLRCWIQIESNKMINKNYMNKDSKNYQIKNNSKSLHINNNWIIRDRQLNS